MLPVSLSFAATLGLLALWLAYRIVRVRYVTKVLVGDGDHPLLRARMRAQANFVEYAPFVLALVVLIELAGGNRTALWAAAFVFLIGRVAHAFGMDRTTANSPARGAGALATWGVLLALSLWAIAIARTGPVGPHETFF